jgi:dihydropteroate synthase
MRKINLKNVQLMGILNLTPDSFSDGGQITDTEIFLQKAKQMLNDGTTILDLGAEASGPNSVDVSEQEELYRLLPYLNALKELKSKYHFKISVDTYKPKIIDLALQNGADIINDITALRAAPPSSALITSNCQIVLMYSKDSSARTKKTAIDYPDIMQTLIQFFEERIAYCEKNGIQKSRLIIDPGMGSFISTIAD